jgi:hypothetical protein
MKIATELSSAVRVHGLKPELLLALTIADGVYQRQGVELEITSIVDGKHSRGSLHYVGMAADLRTRTLPAGTAPLVARQLRAALGDDYDVVLEDTHLHVEFQPKDPL